MSIRAIAQDLYKAQQKVNTIEKKMETASVNEMDVLRGELRAAKREHEMIRKMLDGKKESSSFRKKFGGSGLKW